MVIERLDGVYVMWRKPNKRKLGGPDEMVAFHKENSYIILVIQFFDVFPTFALHSYFLYCPFHN